VYGIDERERERERERESETYTDAPRQRLTYTGRQTDDLDSTGQLAPLATANY